MTVLEAVKHSRSGVFLCKKAIPVAQAALIDPEAVLWAYTGNVQLSTAPDSAETVTKTGVTVITTHRVLFASCIMGNWLTRSIVLKDITDIRIATENSLVYLYIHSPASQLAIQGYSKSINELNTALESAIAEAKTIDPDALTAFRSALAVQPNAPTEKTKQESRSQTLSPRDTVLEAVKHSPSVVFSYKKHIAVAQAALIAPENILWAYTGSGRLYTAPDSAETIVRSGVMVITSHRVLFASGPASNWLIRSIVLTDITDIRIEPRNSTLMDLHIRSLEKHLSILGNERTISNFKAALAAAINKSTAIDPDALADFRSALAAQPNTPEEMIDPEPYFQKHYPDVARAAREMHRDTGVVDWKCRKIVDAYFTSNISRAPKRKHIFPRLPPLSPEQQAALDKRIEELELQGVAYCPQCASVSISVQKRGFFGSTGSSYHYLSGGFRLLYRAIRAHEHVCFCMKCGYTWQP